MGARKRASCESEIKWMRAVAEQGGTRRPRAALGREQPLLLTVDPACSSLSLARFAVWKVAAQEFLSLQQGCMGGRLSGRVACAEPTTLGRRADSTPSAPKQAWRWLKSSPADAQEVSHSNVQAGRVKIPVDGEETAEFR